MVLINHERGRIQSEYPTPLWSAIGFTARILRNRVATTEAVSHLVSAAAEAIPFYAVKVGKTEYFRTEGELALFKNVFSLCIAESEIADTIDHQQQLALKRKRRHTKTALTRQLKREKGNFQAMARAARKNANTYLARLDTSHRAIALDTIVRDAYKLAKAYLQVDRLSNQRLPLDLVSHPQIKLRVSEAQRNLRHVQNEIFEAYRYPAAIRRGSGA